MKKEILGKCMLLISALIWGSSFIVMKNAVDFISPFTLLCIRFVLSTIFISILFFNKIKKIKKQDLLGGFLAGLALFSAFSIQTFGLQLTTPGKNAFLTAVYCTIVPLLSWLYFKKKPDKAQIFAAILCFIGVGFVSLDSSLKVNLGDLYTLIGGFLSFRLETGKVLRVFKRYERRETLHGQELRLSLCGCRPIPPL